MTTIYAAADDPYTNHVLRVDTVANLRLLDQPPSGFRQMVVTEGQTAPGVSGSLYYWKESSTALDDGFTVVKPDSVSGAGRWLATGLIQTGGSAASSDTFNDGTDFTAGSTTQLTLGGTPGSTLDTAVYFDGVYQHKDTYTLAGAVVTFDAAIPFGTNQVEVVRLAALAIGEVADGSVTASSFDLDLGAPVTMYNATDAQVLAISLGTAADPDTALHPLVKVERTVNIALASVTGDGSEQMAAILGIASGTSTNEAQPVGVFGGAKSAYAGAVAGAGDACGVYGAGRFTGTGLGTGIGGFFAGRRDTAAGGGKALAMELSCANFTATAGTYNSTGFSSTSGLWVNANGDSDSGVGIAFGNPNGRQYKVGIGFNAQVTGGKTGGIADSSIRDDSTSAISLDIRGTHATAAINIANGAGGILQNSTQDNFFEGIVKHGATSIAANNAQVVTYGNVGPGSVANSIQKWLKVKDSAGTVLVVPAFNYTA